MRRKQNMITKKVTMKEAYDAFIYQKKCNNLSTKTLELYELHIKKFLDYLQVWNLQANVSPEEYNYFIEHLQDKGTSAVTIASYCRSIRAFIYWLQNEGYTYRFDLAIPKFQTEPKQTYTEEEIKILLKDPKPCSEVDYQTWVFINIVFATGLRLSSVLGLYVKDFVRAESVLYIRNTKNNNALVCALNKQLVSIIVKYIAYFDLKDNDYMFCTANRTQLAIRTIQDNVATYNRNHNVSKTSIHLMRHTFAKNYYLKTKDIYALCRLMDHSDISTTQKYLRDLGVPLDVADVWNPQELASDDKPKRRRGKIKK